MGVVFWKGTETVQGSLGGASLTISLFQLSLNSALEELKVEYVPNFLMSLRQILFIYLHDMTTTGQFNGFTGYIFLSIQ